ncbi:MAG: response regulator [Calditrichae bacterium]|nr:response regulator [Calditrichota bacterium]MCB9057594.1 response regulator [Calditrichia bacterium]
MPLQAKLQRSKSERIKKRILLIENDDEFRITMDRLLSKEGFKLISTENVTQAKPYLDRMLFGLVIYGLNDPLADSLENIRKLKNHKQNPEVLVLSSFNWCEIQSQLNAVNIKEILIKPIKKENLINSILKLENLSI